jgi:arylsulfatase A-like enzyme
MTTLLAAAGIPDAKEKLAAGMTIGGKTYKSHLDGYDLRDVLSSKGSGPRHEFLYWTDGGSLAALRYDQWKLVFLEQRAQASRSGKNRWSNSVYRNCSPCGPIRSSAQTTRDRLQALEI